MVVRRLCRGCRYHGVMDGDIFCNYCLIRKKTRLAQLTPEQRRHGECPMRSEGAAEGIKLRKTGRR